MLAADMRYLLRIVGSRTDGPAEPPAGPPLCDTSTSDQVGRRHRATAVFGLTHDSLGPNPNANAQWTGPLCSLALQASPSDQSEIPSRARSLMRNCPGSAETAGKPPALDAQTPGVVTRKLRVVRNIPTARALPRAEARG